MPTSLKFLKSRICNENKRRDLHNITFLFSTPVYSVCIFPPPTNLPIYSPTVSKDASRVTSVELRTQNTCLKPSCYCVFQWFQYKLHNQVRNASVTDWHEANLLSLFAKYQNVEVLEFSNKLWCNNTSPIFPCTEYDIAERDGLISYWMITWIRFHFRCF